MLHSKKAKKNREIASLTKICTLYTACQIIKELDIDPKKMLIKVGKFAPCIIGTSAHLFHEDELTLYDLLVGMMLPSGNDAAY